MKRRIPGMIEFSFVRAWSASERICEEAVKRECLGRSHRLLFLLEEAVEQRWLGRGGNDRRHMRDTVEIVIMHRMIMHKSHIAWVFLGTKLSKHGIVP